MVFGYANETHDSEVSDCNHFTFRQVLVCLGKLTKHIDCTLSECKGSTVNKRVTLLGPTDDPGQRSGAEGSTSEGGDTVPAHKIIRLGRRRIRARMPRTNKLALQAAQQKQTKGCIFLDHIYH